MLVFSFKWERRNEFKNQRNKNKYSIKLKIQ